MKFNSYELDRKIKAIANDSVLVVKIHTDITPTLLSYANGFFDGCRTRGAITQIRPSASSVDFTASIDLLGQDVANQMYINRDVDVYVATSSSGLSSESQLLFSGQILSHPVASGDLMSFRVSQKQRLRADVPAFGILTNTDFPDLPSNSAGRYRPEVFGMVQGSELIPANTIVSTTLSQNANINDTSILVNDASEFPASGSLTIDNTSYAYTGKSGNRFLGLTITCQHRSGTAVIVPKTNTWIASGNNLTSINNIRADGQSVTASSSNATSITFNSPVMTETVGEAENIQLNFDVVNSANTATDAVNAIRAVTATNTDIPAQGLVVEDGGQNVLRPLPETIGTGLIEQTRTTQIQFPAPSQDSIITGQYAVTYTVATNSFPHNATIEIGGAVAFVLNNGQVDYNPGTVNFRNDGNTNLIPVRITRSGVGPSIDLTITAASRTIAVGNIDDAAFARLANNQRLSVDQTTVNPNRGRITQSRLVCEFFADALTGDADVYFDGVQVGSLSADVSSTPSQSYTIGIDTISSGFGTLQSQSVGGIASQAAQKTDNIVSQAFNYSPTYNVARTNISGSDTFVTDYPINESIQLPPGIVAGTYTFTVQLETYAGDSGVSGSRQTYNVGGVNRLFQIGSGSSNQPPSGGTLTFSVFLSANQSTLLLQHYNDLTPTYPVGRIDNSSTKIRTITGTINTRPTAAAVTVSGGGFSGTPSVSNPNSTNVGVNTRANVNGTGQQVLTVDGADSTRTIINTFDLPLGTDWDYFTNRNAEIRYSGGGTSVIKVVRFFILTDYNVVRNRLATAITADLNAGTRNPVDHIRRLAGHLDSNTDRFTFSVAKSYFDDNNLFYDRVITGKTEAFAEINSIARSALLRIDDSDSSIRVNRVLENLGDCREISNRDLVSDPSVSVRNDLYTDLSVLYSQLGSEFRKSVYRNPTNSETARLLKRNIKNSNPLEFQNRWIVDDTTANRFADDFVRVNSVMRRVYNFELTHQFQDVQPFDFVLYKDTVCKVLSVDYNDVTVAIVAEEF